MKGYKKSPFENAPQKHPNKTRFNLSHEHKTQLLPGLIFPSMRPIETMPGDEVSIQSQYFMRWESMYFPIIHKITMRADTYWFPLRILWPKGTGTNVGWMDWLTKMEEVEHPKVTAKMSFLQTAFDTKVLSYMGVPLLPVEGTADYDTHIEDLNAFPLSAYLMLWDWYERNPQLEDEIWFPLTDGDNTAAFETAFGVTAGNVFPLLSAKWEKDYFTSATPKPQVGDAIKIPLVEEGSFGPGKYVTKNTGATPTPGFTNLDAQGDFRDSTDTEVVLDIMETAGIIKQLREAEVLQSFHERVMKIGDRYDDYIQGLYGIHPQPGVINIPVLLGSTFGKVTISDVLSTADHATATKRQTGDYAGHAQLYEEGEKITYTCHEHGIILQVIQLNANTGYGQGIERLWRRSVQTDYALDMFATIGDQEILKEEVLYTGKTADADRFKETFGYIDRFADYKFKNDIYVGNMSQQSGLSMHLGRWWDPLLTTGTTYSDLIEIGGGLYEAFINSHPGARGGHRIVDNFRIIPAGPGGPLPAQGTTFSWIFHSIYINRPLPLYSTPSL